MLKTFTLLAAMFAVLFSHSQTTEYETGNGTGDNWTGWSTPIVTGVTGDNYTGINSWQFSGLNGNNYTIETYRQFNINSNDIDIYFNCLTQNTTFSVELSQDNVTYAQIGSNTVGAGYSINNLLIPTVDPISSTFYLKIVVSGTFGSPSNTQLYDFKIDAVLNSGNSVSISPTATQNIEEGQNGTMLTAAEAPSAASSREWMWTTTSGSGYQSFVSAETGTTYTPNFATAGTYYVICESDFSGDVQTSNEVQINVTAPASVDEFELGSNVFYTDNNLQIIAEIDDYTVSIYDLSGKMLVSQLNLKSFNLESYQNGVYFVRIDADGKFKTIKIAHSK